MIPILLRETSSGSDAATGIAFTYGSTCASQASSCQFEDNPAIKSERRFKFLVVMFVDWIASPATIKLQVDLRSPIRWSVIKPLGCIGPSMPLSAALERSRPTE
jgi:hypothetical protein